MTQALLKRFFLGIFSVWAAVTMAFVLVHAVPGDPIDVLVGDSYQGADRETMAKALGLDQPVTTQYLIYWQNLFKGNLGESFATRQPVQAELPYYWIATLQLGLSAMLFSILIGIPIGVWSAVHRKGWVDRVFFGLTILGYSIPGFWLAPILIIVFSIKLNWFPAGDRESLVSFVLPTISLGLGLACVMARLTRAAMIEVFDQLYVRMAWAKGISRRSIYYSHALRNALVSILTVISIQIGAVFTGVVITETIFDWPGIGIWLFTAIQGRDYPVVQACVLVIALTYVTVNFVTDLMYIVINPQMRKKA